MNTLVDASKSASILPPLHAAATVAAPYTAEPCFSAAAQTKAMCRTVQQSMISTASSVKRGCIRSARCRRSTESSSRTGRAGQAEGDVVLDPEEGGADEAARDLTRSRPFVAVRKFMACLSKLEPAVDSPENSPSVRDLRTLVSGRNDKCMPDRGRSRTCR